ncbi:uncharacterized protein TRAVEDRAFT_23261 [Trametes versicolor FP-101664 SS1]|uniref:uncharacterized protein n=1 Tax=Trametes versicolor (strain FP-101664) TaxID=717944 RepID=UPI0004623977|nr:uncharacterized protein TRAVEDRAFT_23261 [Trametes versicolor FP-101664 SS1]EIW54033.1 hypothetical protein TRAVEDRAFT_23261 [Trametes versicolor FP-101664 SS1]
MILRTLLVFHLVLTTLELMRAQCAESPCSLLHSRSPFVPLSLTGLCVNLALQPLGDVVAGLVQLILGLLRAAAGFIFATVPVLWKVYRASGEEFMIFIGGITGTSTGIPGSWSLDRLRYSTAHRCPRTQLGPDVSLETLASANSVDSAVVSDCDDSGFESATFERRSAANSSCPVCTPTYASVDSLTHLDSLTLHSADIALLGKHLARTRGMFAWRVYSLIPLSRDPGSDEPSGGLYQRIDAFLKPVGGAVHYVELLVEWVSSASSDHSFLVFSPHSCPSGTSTTDEPRLIGTRVHAFRARKCDPSTSTSAEFLLNKLGLGSRWSCDYNWDTQLGATFDGPGSSRSALKQAVVERWDDDVRAHWVRAGKTEEEADAWAKEILEFEWACEWDEDDSDFDSEDEEESEGSDVSDDCSEGCSGCDEEDEGEEDEEGIAFIQPEVVLPGGPLSTESVPLPELDQSTELDPGVSSETPPLEHSCEPSLPAREHPVAPTAVHLPSPRTFRVVVEAVSDDEQDDETVVYPRAPPSLPADGDEEELILYEVPRTALAVYPPNVGTSAPSDPLAHLRTIYAPVPTRAATLAPPPAVPLPGSSDSTAVCTTTTNAVATTPPKPPLQVFYDCAPTYLPSWTPGLSFLEPRPFLPRVLTMRTTRLAGIGHARIPVSYTVALERKEGTENGVRAVITVHSRNPPPAVAPAPTPAITSSTSYPKNRSRPSRRRARRGRRRRRRGAGARS